MSGNSKRRPLPVYTREQLEFLRENNISGRGYKTLAEMFNDRFNTALNRDVIRRICHRYDLSNGRQDYRQYTDEHIEFLKEHIAGRSYGALASMFSLHFGVTVGRLAISNFCRYLGISNGKPDRRPYTDEQIAFLAANVKGRYYEELAEIFNERFNAGITRRAISELCASRGLSNGISGRYKKGHLSTRGRKLAGSLPDGSEYINARGYIIIKHNGAWRTKQSVIWEQAHGPIPKGHRVVFGDGNKRNFNLNNLFCIPQSQAAIRTNMGLHSDSPERAEAGVALAKLYDTINQRTKKKLLKQGARNR